MIDSSMFPDFIAEAGEHLCEMEANLIRLESEPDNREILNDIFRAMHTIKGSSAYLGLDTISELSHKTENLLEILRQGRRVVDPKLIDALIAVRDRIVLLVAEVERYQEVRTGTDDLTAAIHRHTEDLTLLHEMPAARLKMARVGPPSSEKIPTPPTSHDQEEFALELDHLIEGLVDLPNHNGTGLDARTDCGVKDETEMAGILEDDNIDPAFDDPAFDYDESGDEELFEIYLDQLKDNLIQIRSLAERLSGPDDLSVLTGTMIEKIERLKASANYMGYESFASFYDRWRKRLERYRDRFLSGKPIDRAVIVNTGVAFFIEKILEKFPQIEGVGVPRVIQGGAVDLREENKTDSTEPVVVDGKSLKDDIDEHGADAELFAIFLGQLNDHLLGIEALAGQLPASENPSGLLREVIEKVGRLKASANYMGYENLKDLYGRWLNEIDTCRKELITKDANDTVRWAETHLHRYIARVFDHFPQIERMAHTVRGDAISTQASEEERFGINFQVPLKCDEVLKTARPAASAVQPDLKFATDKDDLLVHEDRTAELFSIDGAAKDEKRDLLEMDPETAARMPMDREKSDLMDRLAIALDQSLGSAGAGKVGTAPKTPVIDLFPGDLEDLMGRDFLTSTSGEKRLSDHDGDAPAPVSDDVPESIENTAPTEESSRSCEVEPEGKAEPGIKDRPSVQVPPVKTVRQSLRVDAAKIDELMNQAGELVINRAWFAQLFNEMKAVENHLHDTTELSKRDFKQVKGLSSKFNEAVVALGRVANELQEGVMKVRMLPISQLFDRYPRLVRDVAHGIDKEVQLDIRGADTELDKMIIEEISDPLIHIIRNAVDHGIESVETRKRLGKPEKGLLRLDAYHEGSHVVVEVSDDGRGIDPEAIKAAALKKGMAAENDLSRMSAREIVELILKPGFSTADHVTRTSGRGVGMDVVKQNLDNLNGTIDIDSHPGQGTRIRIKIPLTLAVIKALLVRVQKDLFTIPLISVEETLRIRQENIKSIKGSEVIYLRNGTIPLVRLSKLFNLPSSGSVSDARSFVVIVSTGGQRVGLMVDELRGQEEVVIKPLPDYLKDNNGFSGATILGDGRISLILDIHALVQLSIGRRIRMRDETNREIRESA